MKFAKTLLLTVFFAFQANPVLAVGEAVVIGADSVINFGITTTSPDSTDSSEAVNIITNSFTAHADTVSNLSLDTPPQEVIDSSDSAVLIQEAFVAHADSVLNLGLDNIEQLPVLSYPTEPEYIVGGISPKNSFVTADFEFKIVYTDSDNDEPLFIRLVLNNTSHTMIPDTSTVWTTLGNANYTDQEQYYINMGKLNYGNYSYHFETSDGGGVVRIPVNGEYTFEVKKNPVIIVPGIAGSELWKGNDEIWADLPEMLRDINDDFLDVLKMDNNGNSIDNSIIAKDVIRKKSGVDFFKGLINEFQTNGYQEPQTNDYKKTDNLFVFPYDWRLSNTYNSSLLKIKINAIINNTEADKVDIMAHSMGGLITKQYILDNQNNTKINKLIFVGTPHLGAPKATKLLLFGDNVGIPVVLEQKKIKEISLNMPSVYELLPSKKYFSSIGVYYKDLIAWPSSIYTYQKTKDFLVNQGLNQGLINKGEIFHNPSMDDFDIASTDIDIDNIYNIVGCKKATISEIRKVTNGSLFRDPKYSLHITSGDETVPIGSALAFPTKPDNTYFSSKAIHSRMPSQDGIRKLIVGITGNSVNNLSLPGTISKNNNQCRLKGKIPSVHSPVEMHIYDSQGNHFGPAENNTFDENIEGVTYEIIENNKFAFLPEDNGQEYTIKLVATDNGSFDFKIATIDQDNPNDNTPIKMVYYSDVMINTNSQAEINITDNSPDDILNFDLNGDGGYVDVLASSILNENELQDIIKPETVINIIGAEGINNWYRSNVEIDLVATDNDGGSGILKTEYSLDNGQTWNRYQASIIINEEGEYTLLYQSTDRAGNTEITKTQIIKIDQTAPEAQMFFDNNVQDFRIIGTDNLSSTTIYITANENLLYTYNIQDEAGNETILVLKKEDEQEIEKNKGKIEIKIKSLRYNNQTVLLPENEIEYEWSQKTEENNIHTYTLKQEIEIKKDFEISAVYKSETDTTKTSEKQYKQESIKKLFKKLNIIKLNTNSGNLKYYY